MVTLIPDNDSGQTVTLSTMRVDFQETNPPLPVYILPDLTISDEDDSPCNPQLLRAAQVTVITSASDSSQDVLMVKHYLLTEYKLSKDYTPPL